MNIFQHGARNRAIAPDEQIQPAQLKPPKLRGSLARMVEREHDARTRRVRERFDAFFVRGRFSEFIAVYRLYRKAAHGRMYSARIAYGCAFKNLPF